MMLAKNSKKKLRRQHLIGLNRDYQTLTVPITETTSGKTSKRSSLMKETQLLILLNKQNGLCFTAKEKADVLMDTFFSGKHLNEKDFEQNFEQMTNHQIELLRQLEHKQERDSLWYNEDVQLHEL